VAGVDVVDISDQEVQKILSFEEGHFGDLKSKDVRPADITKALSAFSNAEGGELFIGIDEDDTRTVRTWRGFERVEDANAHIQVFEAFFPLGESYSYVFLRSGRHSGLVFKAEVRKTRDIKTASSGTIYLRRGAQSLPVTEPEAIERLRRNKGISSVETQTVAADPALITNSETVIEFMLQVVPTMEPEIFLRKNQILIDGKPTVAGLVLFADLPQAVLPKTAIKIYRYKTSAEEGTRETLDFDPISIEGHVYDQIQQAVQRTATIIEGVRVNTADGLESVSYPGTALHEVITNAVIHRDYGMSDDIHIRIFDNRVEVQSPGTLPAHITPQNILQERFARNGVVVRLINKFPNPPNKDVGEGLNTAFEAMRRMKLKPPVISQVGDNVLVSLRHEPLATPEELILDFLKTNEKIANRQARQITYIGSENRMKGILQRMVKRGLIELVPGSTRYNAAYQIPKGGRTAATIEGKKTRRPAARKRKRKTTLF
jgi:ATP-dependent DNA helicase RecG